MEVSEWEELRVFVDDMTVRQRCGDKALAFGASLCARRSGDEHRQGAVAPHHQSQAGSFGSVSPPWLEPAITHSLLTFQSFSDSFPAVHSVFKVSLLRRLSLFILFLNNKQQLTLLRPEERLSLEDEMI